MALNGAFPQAAKSPPALRAGRRLTIGSSHTFTYFAHFVGHDSSFVLAALQKIPVQSYIMHPQAMEANANFGIGLGI